MMTANRRGLYHELDHSHLVAERRSVSDACRVLWRGLVQTTRKPSVLAVFVQRDRGGGHLRV